MSTLVDWDVAVATGRRLVPAGPAVSYQEAADVVAELRRLADVAAEHVLELTQLHPAADVPGVAVVDRPDWIAANVGGFRAVLDPLAEHLLQARRALPAGGLVTAVGSRATGLQLGAVLAYLATRVLGQYELFVPADEGQGRLTLVAPNVVVAERALGVDPHDFRLWVCLHEVTHRTQFTAVPWLREHVQSEITSYLLATDMDPAAVAARLRAALGAVGAGLRGGAGGPSLVEAVQTPEQREILDRITGLMSLLEGHGDYVMDAVGPQVVPSVADIRARFDARRAGGGRLERVLRQLLGIDMKMRQYAEGAGFVRAVVQAAGISGFNRVWTSPNTLPTRQEIADPQSWIRRVVRSRPAVGD